MGKGVVHVPMDCWDVDWELQRDEGTDMVAN